MPGVLHIHGGGMVILSTAGPVYARLRDEIATTGAAVIGVEYRNGAGVLGPHPFPAGLDDCTSALTWVHEHRDELGIWTITVVGESGGANLSLATTLRAKRDGHLDLIDGVFAMVPYISGAYGGTEDERRAHLPSLVENDGYFIACSLVDVMAEVYGPGGGHDTDPLAWPYHATVDDLRGLPPHVISVNELDPLRDEGLVRDEPATRVLDLGCGTGRLALALSAAGYVVTGVDPARASLDVARSKPGAASVTWAARRPAGKAVVRSADPVLDCASDRPSRPHRRRRPHRPSRASRRSRPCRPCPPDDPDRHRRRHARAAARLPRGGAVESR
jgi:acetyl esterase/lipase